MGWVCYQRWISKCKEMRIKSVPSTLDKCLSNNSKIVPFPLPPALEDQYMLLFLWYFSSSLSNLPCCRRRPSVEKVWYYWMTQQGINDRLRKSLKGKIDLWLMEYSSSQVMAYESKKSFWVKGSKDGWILIEGLIGKKNELEKDCNALVNQHLHLHAAQGITWTRSVAPAPPIHKDARSGCTMHSLSSL